MKNFDITYDSKMRILDVDNDIDLTRLLKSILEKSGKFEVRMENDALNAVNAAHEFKPDVILLDVIMPKMNGWQIAKKIKNSKELIHSKIIFFSARLEKNDTGERGKVVGGDMYLSKLVSASDVVNCIENCLLAS